MTSGQVCGARRGGASLLALGLLAAGACVPRPAPGELLVEPSTGLRLRYAPPSTLTIGSPADEVGRDADEAQHQVVLTRGVWVQETEVTQGLWQRHFGSNPSLLTACGAECPVERVSWYDAVAFANRLSRDAGLEACYELVDCEGTPGGGCAAGEGWCHGDFRCRAVVFRGLHCAGYRLPTEAEWEHAARAGTTAATWQGPFEVVDLNSAPALDPFAWYAGNSGVDYRPAWDCSGWSGKERPAEWCGTHPVAGKRANPWGIADALGNVWEWVWDRHGPYPEGAVTDPLGPDLGEDRVRRGCSWSNIPRHCRAADRSADPPFHRDRNWGLRLVRTAQPARSRPPA